VLEVERKLQDVDATATTALSMTTWWKCSHSSIRRDFSWSTSRVTVYWMCTKKDFLYLLLSNYNTQCSSAITDPVSHADRRWWWYRSLVLFQERLQRGSISLTGKLRRFLPRSTFGPSVPSNSHLSFFSLFHFCWWCHCCCSRLCTCNILSAAWTTERVFACKIIYMRSEKSYRKASYCKRIARPWVQYVLDCVIVGTY